MTLEDQFGVRAASAGTDSPLKDRSVIFLFMHGGPSQFETFDPKMDAPSHIRSTTGEIKTTLPGITFGSTFPRLARLAHKFSIVRSFATGDGNHDIKPLVGADTLRANMGSLYSSVAGPSRVDTAMPTNVALFPRSVDPGAKATVTDFGNFEATGELSRTFAPFVPGAGVDLQQDMRLNLPEGRFHDRRALLGAPDNWKRWADGSDAVAGFNGFQQQAFDALHRRVFDAFDLSLEDPRLLERYDTAPLLPRSRISEKWKNIDQRPHPRTATPAGPPPVRTRGGLHAEAFVAYLPECRGHPAETDCPHYPVRHGDILPEISRGVPGRQRP